MLARCGIIGLLTFAVAAALWLSHPGTPPRPSRRDGRIHLRPGLSAEDRLTARIDPAQLRQAITGYSEVTGRELWPDRRPMLQKLDTQLGGRLGWLGVYTPAPRPDSGLSLHRDGLLRADEVQEQLEGVFARAGLKPVARGRHYFELVKR